MSSGLQLCHVFAFVDRDATASLSLHEAGMQESFRRQHPGQGTANACYCFDNAYLELLWVESAADISGPAISRTRLAERSRWRETHASPFGIAVRTVSHEDGLPFGTWDFAPPYLPPGMVIPVALASEDPRYPFVFRSPGNTRPDEWTDGRAGMRQRAAGLAEILQVHLEVPFPPPAGDALEALQAAGILTVETSHTNEPRMVLTLSRSDGQQPRRLSLPDFHWV